MSHGLERAEGEHPLNFRICLHEEFHLSVGTFRHYIQDIFILYK